MTMKVEISQKTRDYFQKVQKLTGKRIVIGIVADLKMSGMRAAFILNQSRAHEGIRP
jgi:hypothetical protein